MCVCVCVCVCAGMCTLISWPGLAGGEVTGWEGRGAGKLQALVYDILPSTTAVFSYAIGSIKLSANEQF